MEKERQRNVLVEHAIQMFITKSLPPLYQSCLIHHILGLYNIKWSRLWPKLSECITRIGTMNPSLLWSILYPHLLVISGHIDDNSYQYLSYSLIEPYNEQNGIVYGHEKLLDRYAFYTKYATLTWVLNKEISLGTQLLFKYTFIPICYSLVIRMLVRIGPH